MINFVKYYDNLFYTLVNVNGVNRMQIAKNIILMRRFGRYHTTDTKYSKRQLITIDGINYLKDEWTNITQSIMNKMNINLLDKNSHPLYILKKYIWNYFYTSGFKVYDSNEFSPIVEVKQNFDQLLIPCNHPSRKKSDNYYINQNYMLRAHTTAHDCDLITKNIDKFIIFGDVYRRDEIDRSHYPIFHQVDGVCLFHKNNPFSIQNCDNASNDIDLNVQKDKIIQLLHSTLESLMANLFLGDDIEIRWVDGTFPFTNPSFELEIRSKNYCPDWIEILGCGLLHKNILKNCGMEHKIGWAFGIGLERLAMLKFHIEDIRLFWSNDPRFFNQFKSESLDIKFKNFSKHDASYRDVSFWIEKDKIFDHNDFFEFIREKNEELIEKVELIDQFIHPITHKPSRCYRITYRSMHKKLSHNEVNLIHNSIVENIVDRFKLQLR